MSKSREQLIKQLNKLNDKKDKAIPIDNGYLDNLITTFETTDDKKHRAIYAMALELRILRLNQKIYGGY